MGKILEDVVTKRVDILIKRRIHMEGKKSKEGDDFHTATIPMPSLLTVKQFSQQNPAFTEGSMRWLLFHRQQNGLERAVVKVGRRVLINVEAFFIWIDEQNGRCSATYNPKG